MRDPIEHQIDLRLASGASLKVLYFSDREMRMIFSYDYIGEKKPGADPDLVNQVRLAADYAEGLLASSFTLSMHVVVPERLGKSFFAGVDISPGAKTYLEFHYRRDDNAIVSREYRLTAIQKGAREQVLLGDQRASLVRQIEFPFPVPDRLPADGNYVRVPFRLNNGEISHFDLPTRTLR